MGVMAAYHDIDGVPCTANPWLMNKVLRDEWGFNGFVLADLGAIRRLVDPHHVANSPREAVWLAINSGVDMQFYDFDYVTFQKAIIDGVENGKISPATLNQAVSRVLRVKFLLGLFERWQSLAGRLLDHCTFALTIFPGSTSLCWRAAA